MSRRPFRLPARRHPVNDGTAGHSGLEHLGVGEHEVGGHKAAETPAVHTKTGAVNVRQALEKLYAAHLVAHLFCA